MVTEAHKISSFTLNKYRGFEYYRMEWRQRYQNFCFLWWGRALEADYNCYNYDNV